MVARERMIYNDIHPDKDVYLKAFETEEQEQIQVAKQARSLPMRGASATIKQIALPQRTTRNSGAKGDKSIAHSTKPEQTAPQLLEGTPDLLEPLVSQVPKPRAKRGRQRKEQNGTNQPEKPLTVSATAKSQQLAGKEVPDGTDTGDVSYILMNPSTVNIIRQRPPPKQTRKLIRPSSAGKDLQGHIGGASSQHTPRTGKERGLARSKDPENLRIPSGTYQPEAAGNSDHYDSYDDNDDDEFVHESDVSNVNESQTKAEPVFKTDSFLINEQVMDDMLSHMKEVGRDAGGKIVRDKGFATVTGAQMSKAAGKLASAHVTMEKLKSADVVDLQKVKIQQERVSASLARLETLTDTMLKKQFGDRSTEVENVTNDGRTNMLKDLYKYVIPKTVDALYASARRYWRQPSIETVDLEEFTALLKITFELAAAARAEAGEVQPKPPKSRPYKLAQPTTRLLPIVRKLLRKCGGELAARKAEEARKIAVERARKRKGGLEEQEVADEWAYLQRLKERNRAIAISLNQSRALLGLPPSSQHNGAQTSSQSHWDIAYHEEFSDENGDLGHERLSLFGRNNSHPEKIPKEWTKEEMEILVDVLWRERGKSLY